MQYELSLLKWRKHDILHDLKLNHILTKGIEHENQVIIIRRIVLGLEQMPVGPKQQLGLLLFTILPLCPLHQLIDQHLGQSTRQHIYVNDHAVLVLDVRYVL